MFSDLVITAVRERLTQHLMRPLSHEVALNNMTFLYHSIRASEDLLRLAKSRSRGALREYYAAHLKEEIGHHLWLEQDLANAGIQAKQTPIPRLAVEMVGSQFYLIRYVDPAALLGYLAVMEGFPRSKALIEKFEAAFGHELPTLRYHATHDVDHIADLVKMIDAVPEKSKPMVLESAIQTAWYAGTAAQQF